MSKTLLTELYHTRDPIENLRIHVTLRKVLRSCQEQTTHPLGTRLFRSSHVSMDSVCLGNRSRIDPMRMRRETQLSPWAPRGTIAFVGKRRSSRLLRRQRRPPQRASR